MIVACGPEDLLKEIGESDKIKIISKEEISSIETGVLIYLHEDGKSQSFNNNITVLINSVTESLSELQLPENILRMNGWKSFVSRSTWEVAGNISEELKNELSAINKKIIAVADEPGFIAARVLSMIINEAWFAMEDNISTEAEIDIAMKLGTGYPYGPFEWTNIIGVQKIYDLLTKLSATDERYTPCSLMKSAAAQ